ncbi:MAG: sensor histidine kinase [Blautia sp.]|nr:sensor histidine kinase [Blautia sp.]
MNLRKKFLLIFLALSILPVLFISLFTYNRYRRLVDTQTRQASDHIMTITATHAESALDTLSHITETIYLPGVDHISILDDLKAYANHPESVSDAQIFQSNERIKGALQTYVYNNAYINGIFLFLPNGLVLGAGYGNDTSVRHDYIPFGDSWYENTLAQKGDTWIYGPCSKDFFLDTESISLSFCTALYSTYDRVLTAVLMVDCDPEYFDLAQVNPLPDIAELSIRNGTDTICSTPEVITGKSGILEYEQSLSLKPLRLNVRIDREMLYEEFGFVRITLAAIFATALAVMILISWILSGSLTLPITTLSELMVQPDEFTDMSLVPYFHYHNEIGTLYTAYQKMLDDKNLYVKNELENKVILLDSQMKSLESQINAHFLYNTLESINSIATLEKVPAISTMSLALGRMFRYSIKTESELVSLSQELTHVKDYTTIQEIRFDHRYVLDTDIPRELESLIVLKLILQPLVENALYHGLNYCKTGDHILVQARRDGQMLILCVEDNGVGIPPEKLKKLRDQLKEKPEFINLGQRSGSGIGIQNINIRIRLYYGEPYGLFLDEQPEHGTRISIRIPVIH